ncbi:hypothetical protein EV189_1274 [Motilibacter rhizosphaerae]|uniref:Uncharacterized protein n=1 Tax=Motilibacter rhizosphaerae TaxID=598652 RepID=A0A4Q7NR29_9ACTN|nr:hypothetical protein [Motilibacter rhizosphaerae]RZS89507.1 hypothetical protein EV189_1274 [Motilibacter rhizosphaerae]
MSEVSGPATAHTGEDDPHVEPAATAEGMVTHGTGDGGSRFGNGSTHSAAGTASLDERSNDGATTGEKFYVTDAGEHVTLPTRDVPGIDQSEA